MTGEAPIAQHLWGQQSKLWVDSRKPDLQDDANPSLAMKPLSPACWISRDVPGVLVF